MMPVLSTECCAQAAQVLKGVLLLVSGVNDSISVLPGWIRWLGDISPATYTLQAEHAALPAHAGWIHLAPDFLCLVASGIVLIPLGVWVFGQGERYALRTGHLKRTG